MKQSERKLDKRTKIQRLKRYLNGENLTAEVLEPLTRINFFLVTSREQKERIEKGLCNWVEERRYSGDGVEMIHWREADINEETGPNPNYIGGNEIVWEEIRSYNPEDNKVKSGNT